MWYDPFKLVYFMFIHSFHHPQITVFTAILSLDSMRIANNRPDLFCCIRLRKEEDNEEPRGSLLYHFMESCYAPFLLHKTVRVTVVRRAVCNVGCKIISLQIYLFSVLFFGMLIGLFNQDIGLSQSIALPKDSYLQDYFNDLSKYLRTGPPVYFVIEGGYDYAQKPNQNKVMFNCNIQLLILCVF